MKSPKSSIYSTFAAALLAASVAFALPVSMRGQTPPTPTAAKKPASVPAARASLPNTSTTTAGAGSGTLTWGKVVYSPSGCVHNGTRAICTFTLTNRGNAATLLAAYQMNTMQFVDDAHVPHASDAAYFVDNYGTRQAALFVNSGEAGTLIREFPNVNDRVANGEFHLGNQVVDGVSVGAPETIPAQGVSVANTPATPQPAVPAVQPVTANTPTSDPTTQVQQGINQVNDKKQKAKSIWNQIKTIKK